MIWYLFWFAGKVVLIRRPVVNNHHLVLAENFDETPLLSLFELEKHRAAAWDTTDEDAENAQIHHPPSSFAVHCHSWLLQLLSLHPSLALLSVVMT